MTKKSAQVNLIDFDSLGVEFPVAVAFSGGADSTALLLACVEHLRMSSGKLSALSPKSLIDECGVSSPSKPLGLSKFIRAIHIHHGLQPAADAFALHCQRVCDQLGVPLHIERVHALHSVGESPEEAARNARYAALARVAGQAWGGEVTSVLLGQHADDQVETLVLALSRGAGLPGISSMAARFERSGVCYIRPMLALSAQTIRDWLLSKGQSWIEDPSNADTQFTRNKIRAEILPPLISAFPAFRQTAARSAAHAAQAQLLLNEVALEDLERTGNPPQIKALQLLSLPRCTNVLRYWFVSLGATPSSTQLQELISQINACTTRRHRIEIKLGSGFVRRDQDVLRWSAAD